MSGMIIGSIKAASTICGLGTARSRRMARKQRQKMCCATGRTIHAVGHTLPAGLPASKRHHAAGRLGADDHGRLDRLLAGVVQALPLGPQLVPLRVLGTNADGPGIDEFIQAGDVLQTATTHADLREATDLRSQRAADEARPFQAVPP